MTSQASRYRAVWFQGVRCREIAQFGDVLIRPSSVRHGQKDRNDQSQGSAKCGRMARFFTFLYGEHRILQRSIEQASIQQRTCHADEQEASVMKQVLSGSKARTGLRVAETGLAMLLCNDVISQQMIGGDQHRICQRHVIGISRLQRQFLALDGDVCRTPNVHGPMRIHEESAQDPQFVGEVSLIDRNLQRARKSRSDALIVTFSVHQGQR